MIFAILIGIGFAAGGAAMWIVMRVHGIIEGLRRRISDLEEQVKRLEDTSRKRLPHQAQEELLDAMAALDRLTMDVDVMQAIKENARAHIINALQSGTKRSGEK